MSNLIYSALRTLVGGGNEIRAPAPRASVVPLGQGRTPQRVYGPGLGMAQQNAEKLSAVYAAVALRSNDLSVLPPL